MSQAETHSQGSDDVLTQYLKDLEGAADPRQVWERYAASYPARACEFQDYLALGGKLDAQAPRVSYSVPPQLGDFALGRLIGQGGNGEIYQATQVSLGRRVAVKINRRDRARQDRRRASRARARASPDRGRETDNRSGGRADKNRRPPRFRAAARSARPPGRGGAPGGDIGAEFGRASRYGRARVFSPRGP